MPDHPAPESLTAPSPDEQDGLRALNRTPHPYHHHSGELPHPSERFVLHGESPVADNGKSQLSPTGYPAFSKESTPASDSGTEADDEHFLRGLPAPKAKLHKGLRGRNEVLSGVSTPSPSPSPAALGDEQAQAVSKALLAKEELEKRHPLDAVRRNKVLVRRATEAGIIVALGCMVRANRQVSPLVDVWHRDLQLLGLLCGTLLALYPLRVVAWVYRRRQPSRWLPLKLPSNFDPAPLLYPPTITILVSLLVSVSNPAAILPSIILSICSIPQSLIPKVDLNASYDTVHWALSCLPLLWGSSIRNPSRYSATYSFMSEEEAALLYPLHRTLCIVLHHLTTTSLLTAELQLLSIALINVLILAVSPQMQILKALLWVGGLAVLVSCGAVIRWGISLARVPKWRFRRAVGSQKYRFWKDVRLFSWHAVLREVLGSTASDSLYDTASSDAEEDEPPVFSGPMRVRTTGPNAEFPVMADGIPALRGVQDGNLNGVARRHTLPRSNKPLRNGPTHTPSGRRKRATSTSMRPYFKLTQAQATMRKWLYAFYVYASMLSIIFIGVRAHIQKHALGGNEPIGWGLGYVFGDWSWFRFEVVSANLERWICLPPHPDAPDEKLCHMGWVQHVRHDDFGEATTRLILSAYWLVILVFGLVVVFRLKETYEVDTRRKVFHFMMVGMFLPSTYIDPTYAALALSLVLAVFLMLDLLRASQLPPLSKPIASFLAPYVDGRDFRGPVVVSHIFLLIGCAIPLWLALAALPRTGTGCMAGWEVPTRDASMVSGVICVGLGDAAASLIGRRYGHRKWLWGGGKSLEGSAAFAAAVFAGLAAAGLWQRVGGWPVTDEPASILASARNAGVCASMASLTEAVLTGGNDNVIVPVVLWTCVKSLGI
ncbi:Dolichol kinase sec59 [Tolypocladium capitatum]|uniref:dolichol kinase n=1 Tax=Tolypocladium capitatum TaxID=45235 RepID=A0A2K3QG02_9HYPO|nr:Dolichol kinase sec59 [Tolypocladium capitatum]